MSRPVPEKEIEALVIVLQDDDWEMGPSTRVMREALYKAYQLGYDTAVRDQEDCGPR